MQIRHLPAPEDCPAWVIKFDCDDERRLSDSELMRLLENCQGVSWEESTQRYALNGRDFGPTVDGRAVIARNGDEVRATLFLP